MNKLVPVSPPFIFEYFLIHSKSAIYKSVSFKNVSKCFTYVSPESKMFHLQILKMRTISLKFFLKPLKHGRYAFSVNLRIIYDRKKAEIATGIRKK